MALGKVASDVVKWICPGRVFCIYGCLVELERTHLSRDTMECTSRDEVKPLLLWKLPHLTSTPTECQISSKQCYGGAYLTLQFAAVAVCQE